MPELITSDQNVGNANRAKAGGSIVSYCMTLIREARDSRDLYNKAKWDRYERKYRGLFAQEDKTREAERSRLIAPALTQAIDSIHASFVDAIFSRQNWLDVRDENEDQDKQDIARAKKNMMEDLDHANFKDSISKIILNGCIYGTGIGKLNLFRKKIPKVTGTSLAGPQVEFESRNLVALEPVQPWEFVKDTQSRDIDSGLFCGTETYVPKNVVWTKQLRGVYRTAPRVDGFHTSKPPFPGGESQVDQTRVHGKHDGSVWVSEYYGLVPARLVRKEGIKIPEDKILGNGMVECLVTIGNETELLRVSLNPYTMQDRPVVAYQHTNVPGRWWGDGVAAKGWNAAVGLDAELRARMDALALLTSPMMGADITRLPRNPDTRVRPGKMWLTRGRPSEVLERIDLGNIDPNTFNQSSEMERLVQVATGSVESNAPLNTDRRNETASGISMIQSSALKRQRVIMRNIENQLLNPSIQKTLWRLMQFNPERYPADYSFCVKSTMGILAKEFEQANLTSLLSVIPAESPAHGIILRGIIEMSNAPQRDQLLAALDEAAKPDPQKQQIEQEMLQIQLESARQSLQEQKSENDKTLAEVRKLLAEIEKIKEETRLMDEEVEIQALNAAAAVGKTKFDRQSKQEELKVKREEIKRRPRGGSQ